MTKGVLPREGNGKGKDSWPTYRVQTVAMFGPMHVHSVTMEHQGLQNFGDSAQDPAPRGPP
eukprot:2657165-Amphidinium_carterae.2